MSEFTIMLHLTVLFTAYPCNCTYTIILQWIMNVILARIEISPILVCIRGRCTLKPNRVKNITKDRDTSGFEFMCVTLRQCVTVLRKK